MERYKGYACVAQDNGGGRCQELAVPGAEGSAVFCEKHAEHHNLAPAPDIVLLAFDVGASFGSELVEADIPFKVRDEEGISSKRRPGVPIFGKEGKRGIDGGVGRWADLLIELKEAGYILVDLHWFNRQSPGGFQRNQPRLICSFAKEGEEFKFSDGAKKLLRSLTEECAWAYVHVWANPPDENGRIIHSVNLIGHQKGCRGKCGLRFIGGFWAVSPAE